MVLFCFILFFVFCEAFCRPPSPLVSRVLRETFLINYLVYFVHFVQLEKPFQNDAVTIFITVLISLMSYFTMIKVIVTAKPIIMIDGFQDNDHNFIFTLKAVKEI